MQKIKVIVGGALLLCAACAHKVNTQELQTKTEKFINENLMRGGGKIQIAEIKEEDGVYKASLRLPDGKTMDAYVSRSGKLFFPQAFDMVNPPKQQAQQAEPASAPPPKTARPVVELFIMSYCPYGLQMQKGFLPVMELLGNKMDASVKFCNYAMHEKREIDENLLQHCIQKKEPAKYNAYQTCFLAEGKSENCQKTAKIQKGEMKKCIADADKEFEITKKYNDRSTWSGGQFPPFLLNDAENKKYGVQGSPTLVINGQQVQANRDPQSLLKAVCSAFTTPPPECQKTLASDAPSPGFGIGSGGGGSDGGCGAK